MKEFNKKFLLFILCLFSINTKCFALKTETNDLNKKENQLNNNQFKENIYKNSFKNLLQVMGFSNIESNAAYTSLVSVLPLEILKDRANIILPTHFEKEKVFAVNINDYDSIVLKKENNKFPAFITSAKQANKIISDPKDFYTDKENMIRVNNDLIEYDLELQVILSKIIDNKEYLVTRIDLFKNDNYKIINNVIEKGESIYELLKKYKISVQVINNILNAVKPYYDLGKIRAGKKLAIAFDLKNNLQGISFKTDKTTKLQIVLIDNKFKVFFYNKPYKIKNHLSEIIISSNFYNDAEAYALPKSIFFDLVKILSFSLDFQRDIRKNTNFIVLYEKLYDYQNNLIATGKILYSEVLLKNDSLQMYLFESNEKEAEFYDSEGKSIRKTLMKTPIDGARLSSGFGKRRHPILGYNKMHKGIDFAAKTGTPIYAAGDGIIERANFYGGYGRYIRIRHNSEYKTAYAHLSKFAKEIKKNIKVKQGQIIGYVGSSGRSTGPHLHYEVIFNKKQINPNRLKMPEVKALNKNEMFDFNKQKENITKILLDIKN